MGESGFWWRLAGVVSGRRSWVVLVLMVLVAGGVMAAAPTGSATGSPSNLPPTSESARVDEILATFPDAGAAPVIGIATRTDGAKLTPGDVTSLTTALGRMKAVDRGVTEAPAPPGQGAPPVIPSQDGLAAIVNVPVSTDLSGLELTGVIDKVRDAGRSGLDPALTLKVTGGPAFGADIANAFKGADFTLLGVTALVVAVLLLLTYRSPVLWLIPLLVVGLADRVAGIVAALVSTRVGLVLDGSTTGITSVLVFGAGTNYALLLVSRYREELREESDHRLALRRAVRWAGPAIVASNLTVVLAVASLLLATTPSNRVLGLSSAVGLLVALVFVLLLLPPALALTGRRLFWPFIPKAGETAPTEKSAWYRIANVVRRRPVLTLAGTVPVLLIGIAGILTVSIGLSQTQQFRVKAESAEAFETLAAHYSTGTSNPTTVVTRTEKVGDVLTAVKGTSRVMEATPTGASTDGWTRIRVVLDAEPASSDADHVVADLRERVHAVPDAQALVGGPDAKAYDGAQALAHDQRVVIPVILAVVFLVLVVLLRALIAPLLLISATILSAFAATGAGAWVSVHVFGFPALDDSVPLFAFLFLVALGVDYTIFLVTRAKEETPEYGTKEGIVQAVALTGGVITSAGVVLAAVFAVLGVLPLITLTQLGIVVGFGILLDAFVVRTVVIPALFSLVGDKVWWPAPVPSRPRLAVDA